MKFYQNDNGHSIAYKHLSGRKPGVLFLGGFFSDMEGTKATYLYNFCEKHQISYTCFDYFGHGHSSGKFEEGSIGQWLEDALHIFDHITKGPQIVVGSSMGGWIMFLLALLRKERVQSITGIAPAPDFTEKLMWAQFPDNIKNEILTNGVYYQPSEYDENPYPITKKLIEDGRNHLLLDNNIDIECPVRLIHGQKDEDVPYDISMQIIQKIKSKDVELCLIKEGDHRLSSDEDLKRLSDTIYSLYSLSNPDL